MSVLRRLEEAQLRRDRFVTGRLFFIHAVIELRLTLEQDAPKNTNVYTFNIYSKIIVIDLCSSAGQFTLNFAITL